MPGLPSKRPVNESQRAMVGARLIPLYEKAAKARRGARTDLQANLPEGDWGQARDKAAAQVSGSGRSVSYAKRVIEDGVGELAAAVSAGSIRVSDAVRATQLTPAKQKKAVKLVVQRNA